jgi:hypothetical protein
VRGTNGSLNAAGEVTKRRPSTNGARGGKPWTKGAVYKVLANRAYLGEAVHKGVAFPGEHAAIVDQRIWDKAHALMAEPAHRRGAATRAQVPACSPSACSSSSPWRSINGSDRKRLERKRRAGL